MLVNLEGTVQPPIGTKAHWVKFREIAQHPDLFDPLREGVVREVTASVTKAGRLPASIDSARLGAEVLGTIGGWWHGEFPRRFRHFENGAERGLVGMVLWNHLAHHGDWWCFTEREDPHGYAETHKLYSQLPPGHALIPADPGGINL